MRNGDGVLHDNKVTLVTSYFSFFFFTLLTANFCLAGKKVLLFFPPCKGGPLEAGKKSNFISLCFMRVCTEKLMKVEMFYHRFVLVFFLKVDFERVFENLFSQMLIK